MTYKEEVKIMLENVNWTEIINTIILYIDKDWKYLIFKDVFSRGSFGGKCYYSIDGKAYTDLYDEIDLKEFSLVDISELRKITELLKDINEKLFLTMKVEKSGNVKIIYRYTKEGNQLPIDEVFNYDRLSDNDITV